MILMIRMLHLLEANMPWKRISSGWRAKEAHRGTGQQNGDWSPHIQYVSGYSIAIFPQLHLRRTHLPIGSGQEEIVNNDDLTALRRGICNMREDMELLVVIGAEVSKLEPGSIEP